VIFDFFVVFVFQRLHGTASHFGNWKSKSESNTLQSKLPNRERALCMGEDSPPAARVSPRELFAESRFDPDEEEEKVRALWASLNDFQKPGAEEGARGAILLEPVDLTGPIHMGDALGAVLADVSARARRMKGENVHLITGIHHVGVSTPWALREWIPRAREGEGAAGEEPVGWKELREWKEMMETEVVDQFRDLGITFDADRFFFTLDESSSRAVQEGFHRFYEDGLVYRQKRLEAWCPSCTAVLSPKEVESAEEDGEVHYVRYPIEGEVEKFLTVATSELETIAGDDSLLVSGDDERYQEVLGKNVLNPLTEEAIPVLADLRADGREGTGVYRSTPGREAEDFRKARASGIEPPPLFDREGKLGEGAGPVLGLEPEGARRVVQEVLEERGLLDRSEKRIAERQRCGRCRKRIVHLMNEHWYLRMHILAERAAAAVRAGMVQFQPARWEKAFLSWTETVAPWRISQGKAFGHRLAVRYCCGCGTPSVRKPAEDACKKCGGSDFREGEEVFDPWFSSVVGTLAAFGWPAEGEKKAGFPISLVISRQADFQDWLARFLALGSPLTGRPVFQRAVVGRKEGGGIDPRDMVRPNGADAVRLGVVELPYEVQDIHLTHERFDSGRNFVNKIWNVTRFAARHITPPGGAEEVFDPAEEDRWILGRLDAVVREVTRGLTALNPGQAVGGAMDFVRHDLSAWYLEMAKRRIQSDHRADAARRTLGRVLFTLLRILHPVIPFVTETIWRRFLGAARGRERAYPLLWAPWPSGGKLEPEPELETRMELLKKVVRAVRSIRTKHRLARKDPVSVVVSFLGRSARDSLAGFEDLLKALVNANDLSFGIHLTKPASCATEVQGDFQVFVPLLEPSRGFEEVRRLMRRRAKLEDKLVVVSRPLESREFMNKAPVEVRESLRRKRDLLTAQILHLNENIEELSRILEGSGSGAGVG
jgi:valyl-tRNA synthetase